jgi:hypothetical protein
MLFRQGEIIATTATGIPERTTRTGPRGQDADWGADPPNHFMVVGNLLHIMDNDESSGAGVRPLPVSWRFCSVCEVLR